MAKTFSPKRQFQREMFSRAFTEIEKLSGAKMKGSENGGFFSLLLVIRGFENWMGQTFCFSKYLVGADRYMYIFVDI